MVATRRGWACRPTSTGTTAVLRQPQRRSSTALNAESAMPSAARGHNSAAWTRASATFSLIWSSHPS